MSIKWMFTEAAAGKKPADIAEVANARGYRTKVSVALRTGNKRGGILWTARQVVATLRNPVHIGMLRDGDWRSARLPSGAHYRFGLNRGVSNVGARWTRRLVQLGQFAAGLR